MDTPLNRSEGAASARQAMTRNWETPKGAVFASLYGLLFDQPGGCFASPALPMDLQPVPFILLVATICSAAFFTAAAVLASF